jgi:hypothetical protein
MRYKIIPVVLLWISVAWISVHSQVYSESKSISRSFAAREDILVDITNKYGKIHVIAWPEDSVKFDIDINVKSNSVTRVNRTINGIDIDFTSSGYYLVAQTNINQKYNSVIDEIVNIAENILVGENEVSIDYKVYLPGTANLKIENKYGDVFLDDIIGNVTLNLSNGDLKANKLMGQSDIEISFGDANIYSMKKATMAVSYSDLKIRNATDLDIESKSSEIAIDKTTFLNIKSKRDKYKINTVNDLFIDAYFTDIIVDELSKEFNSSTTYGYIYLEFIERGFSFININSEYTDVDLFFAKGTTYDLDINHSKEIVLRYPEELADLEEKVISGEDGRMLTYGKLGKANSTGKVEINAPKKSNINIFYK